MRIPISYIHIYIYIYTHTHTLLRSSPLSGAYTDNQHTTMTIDTRWNFGTAGLPTCVDNIQDLQQIYDQRNVKKTAPWSCSPRKQHRRTLPDCVLLSEPSVVNALQYTLETLRARRTRILGRKRDRIEVGTTTNLQKAARVRIDTAKQGSR